MGPNIGRSGGSLIEVLVATLLVAVGVSILGGSFDASIRRLDEAHLGLHAAILMTEASAAADGETISRPVGPGRMEVLGAAGSIRVRYVPPNGQSNRQSRVYGQERSWTVAP